MSPAYSNYYWFVANRNLLFPFKKFVMLHRRECLIVPVYLGSKSSLLKVYSHMPTPECLPNEHLMNLELNVSASDSCHILFSSFWCSGPPMIRNCLYSSWMYSFYSFRFWVVRQIMLALRGRFSFWVSFRTWSPWTETHSLSISLFHNSFCLIDLHFNFPSPHECHEFWIGDLYIWQCLAA